MPELTREQRDELRSVARRALRWVDSDGNHPPALVSPAHLKALLDALDQAERERDGLRAFLSDEASTLRAHHVGRDAVKNPVDAAYLADLIDAALDDAPMTEEGN